MDTISDYRTQTFLKNYINQQHLNTNPKLKNIYLCGTGVLKHIGHEPAVLLFKNKNPNDETHPQAKLFGAINCNSVWSCPVCSAKAMAKKGAKIACAIDALAKWKNQYAVMITFTIPHTAGMSCQLTFNILLKAWKRFTKAGNQKSTTYKYILKNNKDERSKKGGALGVGKKGTVKIYKKGYDVYGDFRESLNITYTAKVFEFTWGENSWHPHIHALFWIPKKNLNKILAFEKKLQDRWWDITKKTTQEFIPTLTDKLFPEWKKEYHPGVHISRDKHDPNKPHIQKSSYYITGWSGDLEATSQNKTARNGHYSPFQLLAEAQKTTDTELKEKYLNLFIEYALATFKHIRVAFSKNRPESIESLISRWKKSHDYKESYAKKNTKTEWELVYWFNEQNWSELCFLETIHNIPIRATILKLSNDIDKLELFLSQINSKFIMHKKYREAEFFENMLNSA